MAIFNPGFLGLVFIKNDKTLSCVEMHKEHWSKFPEMIPGGFNEDDYLIGFSVGMSGSDLEYLIDNATTTGAVLGQDFFATSSVAGVISDLPLQVSVDETPDGIFYSWTEA